MRTIDRYIAGSFLLTAFMALFVFTFVLSIGIIFKITDLLAKGAAWQSVFQIFIYSVPASLTYSIPIGTLIGSLLVFGRLSADSEITALKACGVNIWRIVLAPIIISLIFAALCLYINNEIGPRGHFGQRKSVAKLAMESPLQLLDEGRFIREFPELTVYIGEKRDNEIFDVRISDAREPGIVRDIRAKRGTIRVGDDGADVVVDLFDVRIDPLLTDLPGDGFCDHWPIVIKDALKQRECPQTERDMTFAELLEGIDNPKAHFPNLRDNNLTIQRMILLVELHKRITLSLACLAFVMLGIPLGIKSHRKESSIGIGISLLLVFNFYLFIIVGEAMAQHPAMQPHLIVWTPVVISIALGTLLLHRAQ
ncbi:MAG: LptF/LptG family permease [Lentisphaerae bacterium]|nr:LptF/LptG family permease [Lentisphaerota bacterium]